MVEIGEARTTDKSRRMYPTRISELWIRDASSQFVKVLSDVSLSIEEYELDLIGSIIWVLCDGHHSIDDIVNVILREIDGKRPSRKQIVADVLDFLHELSVLRLIDLNSDSQSSVLLVVPPFPTLYESTAILTPEYSAPPLGLCYIAATLRENGFDVQILDLHMKAGMPEDVVKECRKMKPRVVGITSTTPTFLNAVKVAQFIKAFDAQIITVLGGAHASTSPEECLRTKAFDYVCIGEGEQSMLDLVNALTDNVTEPRVVPGFAFLDDSGQIAFSAARDRIVNLDILPHPARDLIELDEYYQKGSIISSRGCPFNCNYCACSVLSGQTYRIHSVEYVLDEIQFLIDTYSYSHFDFHDDVFNLDSDRVSRFCDGIKNRDLRIDWGCFCRAAQLTKEMAIEMADAGCSVVQFGVESGSQRVLDSMGKQTSLSQIENAVTWAVDSGIRQVVCGFIIGHAEDTEETIRETINFGVHLSNLGATRLTLSLLTPYPGTAVYANRENLGIHILNRDWEDYIFSRVVIETSNISQERLRELYVEGIMKFLDVTRI